MRKRLRYDPRWGRVTLSERLAEDMLKINPADVRYLSYAELKIYGLQSYDPAEQEMRDIEEGQDLGIDRREFIRRQVFRKEICGSISQMKVKSENFITCNLQVMKSGNFPN